MSFAAQGDKKEMYKIKINKHLTLSYRNCHEANEEEVEEKEEKKNKCTKSRQPNTSHSPTKTISKTVTHPRNPCGSTLFYMQKKEEVNLSYEKSKKKKIFTVV